MLLEDTVEQIGDIQYQRPDETLYRLYLTSPNPAPFKCPLWKLFLFSEQNGNSVNIQILRNIMVI